MQKSQGEKHFSQYTTVVENRGTYTLDFSRKTTNAVLSDLQIE